MLQTARHPRQSSGFTLIELLITILIIGILAAVGLAAYNGQRDRARDSKARAGLETAVRQARSVWTDNETFGADTVTKMQAGESSLDIQAGTDFPALPGVINTQTTSAGLIALRSVSENNRQQMIVDDPQRGITVRYAGNPALTQVTNGVPNPSAEGGITSWYSAAYAGATRLSHRVVPDDGYLGSSSFEATFNLPAVGGHTQIYPVTNSSPHVPAISPGQRVYASVMFKVVEPVGIPICLDIGFYRANLTYLTQGNGPCVTSTGAWQHISWERTAVTDAAYVYSSVKATSVANPLTYRVDNAMIVVNTDLSPSYFDGFWPGASWTGATDGSPSVGPAGRSTWGR